MSTRIKLDQTEPAGYRALFDEQYLGQIIMCVIVINAWNRLGISTGIFPSDR